MNDYALCAMLYTSAQMALLSCIRYWLYKNNLRVCAARMYFVLFAISFAATGLWLAAGGIAGISFSSFRICVALFMFAVSCLIIKEPFFKHTYAYSFIMVYNTTIEITANFAQQRFSPGSRGCIYVLTAFIIVAVSFVPAVRYLKRIVERISEAANDRLWGWLCVISFSFVFMNLLLTFPMPRDASLRALISRYLMFFGVIGMYAATIRMLETMREAAMAKAQRDLAGKRVAMQQSYYDRMIAQMDEVRRARHDQRHHRAAMSALIKEGDLAALAEYIDAAARDEDAVPVTGNFAADSILLYYIDAAKALDTRMETDLAIGIKTPLSAPDLCVVLGNLLENALEAQRYIAPESRYIRVVARGDEARLTLAVDNRFDGVLKTQNGAYLSRKEGSEHGLGLSSVKAVCEKYGGVLQLEADGGLFMAGVVIGL
ncbi:MAG: GHKL domain-containing protein [Clostridia bacterium]|nr:GHKL domain-containing protein [Clostridia bacterium]